MKNLLPAAVLLFVFSLFGVAQEKPACPTVSVLGPIDLVIAVGKMIFTAEVKGVEPEKISYKWTVSAGEINEGQGTSTLKIVGGPGMTVTATVEIKGFPEGCRNVASTVGNFEVPERVVGSPLKLDEFGDISFKDLLFRIDGAARRVKKEKNNMLTFIVYGAENRRQLFINRISKYLTEKHKLSKDRFEFIDGRDGDYKIEIWLPPKH